MNKRKLGYKAERIALNYLIARNLHLIEANWHCGNKGELDLILKDNSLKSLVFVEVKHINKGRASPETVLSDHKIKQLRFLVESYLMYKGYRRFGKAIRGDLLVLVGELQTAEMVWFRGCF